MRFRVHIRVHRATGTGPGKHLTRGAAPRPGWLAQASPPQRGTARARGRTAPAVPTIRAGRGSRPRAECVRAYPLPSRLGTSPRNACQMSQRFLTAGGCMSRSRDLMAGLAVAAVAAYVFTGCGEGSQEAAPVEPELTRVSSLSALTAPLCPVAEESSVRAEILPRGGTVSLHGHSVYFPPGAVR